MRKVMIITILRTEEKALSRKEIIESVRDSLENLQLEYIDLLVNVINIVDCFRQQQYLQYHDQSAKTWHIPKGDPQERPSLPPRGWALSSSTSFDYFSPNYPTLLYCRTPADSRVYFAREKATKPWTILLLYLCCRGFTSYHLPCEHWQG